MKKGLLIIAAVLMLASVVQAADNGTTSNCMSLKNQSWPCTFTPLKLATVKVTLDVGYYVRFCGQNSAIKLTQTSLDTMTYSGCTKSGGMSIESNFNCRLSLGAVTKLTGQGVPSWTGSATATIGPDITNQNATMDVTGPTAATPVFICVTIPGVTLATATPHCDVQIATIDVKVVPTDAFGWTAPTCP